MLTIYTIHHHKIVTLSIHLFLILGSVTTVESVVGMMTNLPCNITPSLPDDKIQLVLWYKVISLETPIEYF